MKAISEDDIIRSGERRNGKILARRACAKIVFSQ